MTLIKAVQIILIGIILGLLVCSFLSLVSETKETFTYKKTANDCWVKAAKIYGEEVYATLEGFADPSDCRAVLFTKI